jgi:hypothetical protein
LVCGANEVARERTAFVRADDGAAAGRQREEPRSVSKYPTRGHVRADARCRRENGLPHFHATHAGETVVIAIQTGDVIAGNVPARALSAGPRVVCAAS